MANCNRGFTLPDFLAALAISGILTAGTAAVTSVISAARSSSGINFIERQIHTARSTAVHLGREVTLCASQDGRHCVKRWRTGAHMLMFFDRDGDKTRDVDETVLLQKPFPRGEYQLRASNRRYLRFRRSGAARDNGSWYYCANAGSEGVPSAFARQLTVNRGGRVYRSRDRDGDGLHDHNTAPGAVTCPE